MVRRLISDEDVNDDWKIPVGEKNDLGLRFSQTDLLESAVVQLAYTRPGNSMQTFRCLISIMSAKLICQLRRFKILKWFLRNPSRFPG